MNNYTVLEKKESLQLIVRDVACSLTITLLYPDGVKV